MRLPDLSVDVVVHVFGEPGGSYGPALDLQSRCGTVHDAADPGPTCPLHEAFSPTCSHQGDLSTGQQRDPPLRCHRLSDADPDLDQKLSLRR